MSKKKYPKPIIKACWKCKEQVAVVMEGDHGRCPHCRTKLYNKTARAFSKKQKMIYANLKPIK